MSDPKAYLFPSATSRAFRTELLQKPASFWWKRGEKMAIELYHFAQHHVPAYKAFLSDKGFDAKSVKSVRSFGKVPPVTKDSYLRAYPYEDLFPPLALHRASTVSATSGSTGEPFFFPRSAEHDKFYERSMEVLLSKQWDVGKRSTLCIIGFGLGIWIGGIFTYKNFNKLAEGKLQMTLVPVGPNKDLYLKTFKKFAPHYDQVVLMGYPPFLKDLFDAGVEHGIEWRKHRLRILTAAEGYSERFRNHVAELAGCDPVRDMVNIYGTVEQGTIAHETALSNMIRRIASERADVFAALFPDAQNIPTLAQYYPDHVYFEELNGQLIATGFGSSIPLVRYAFNDLGGVIRYEEMYDRLRSLGVDMEHEIRKYGIADTLIPLPFVYIHARADFVIVFRGANIYPEEIRAALDSKILQGDLTGRFTAVRVEREDMTQGLDIHVELAPHVHPSERVRTKALETIISELRSRNSEFANNYASDAAASTPQILLHPYGDPQYFSGTGKQQWVKR